MFVRSQSYNNFLIFLRQILERLNIITLFYFLPLFFLFGKWKYTSLMVFLLFAVFVFDRIHLNKKIYIPSKFVLTVIFLSGLVSVYKAPVFFDGIYYFLGTIVTPVFLLIIFTNIKFEEHVIINLMNLMVITGVILGFVSIYTSIFVIGSFDTRLPSLWKGYNMIAAYFMITVFFCLAFLLYKKSNLSRIFYAACLLVVLFGLFLTQTRGMWIATLFAASFYILKKPKAIIPVFLLVGFIAFLFFPIIHERFLTIKFFAADYSALARIQAWIASVLMIKDYWLLGAGFDSFLYLRNYYIGMYLIEVPHSHNTYLRLWLELGISGFLAYIYIFFASIYYTFKLGKRFKDINSKIQIDGLQMSLIGLSVGFMFDTYFSLYGNTTIIIWLLICISFNLKYFKMQQSNV